MVYLDQIRHLLDHGQRREDRTGTGTLSIFGMQGRYDIRDGVIPLLTTKKVFWKSIVEEVLWFIRGETSSQSLADRGVHIWDANGSRTFLDSQGFVDRQEGDLGPVYGFQWRHFGAEYRGTGADYRGEGVDQLSEVIRLIRTDPHSRRIILSAWNPTDLSLMALPPCHLLVQFYVQDGHLSSHLYQRSGDMGLGVPFNIASYALLTHMIAHVTGLKAGEFVHTLGDAHIYVNHVDALKEQLTRQPKQFPTVQFVGQLNEVDDFRTESIQLIGYDPYPVIKMPMAV